MLRLSNWYHDEEKDIIFAIELKLFSIGTISLLETIQFGEIIDMEIMDISVKNSTSKLYYGVQSTKKRQLATYMN